MAKPILLFWLTFYLVLRINANLIDEATKLEGNLESAKIKRQAKNLVGDVNTADLLDQLKKEVLGSNDLSKLKTKLDDVLAKKESEILTEKKVEAKKEVSKKEVELGKKAADSSVDFLKAAALRNDDFENDKAAKRVMDMMVDDILTKDMKALPAGVNKRGARCVDTSPNCKFAADRGRCTKDERMVKICPKTCHLCKAASPPKCSKSTFGCCWDKSTVKQDGRGSNCPACKDQFKNVCKLFRSDCGTFSDAGVFMLRNCKKTCNFCKEECKDDPKVSFYCGFWKKDLDWCRTKKETMKHYCPSTCGFC